MKLIRRKKAMKKKKSNGGKKTTVAKAKRVKKVSLAVICAELVRENPTAAFSTLAKKAEAEFKERGIYSYIIENTLNDVLDSMNVLM